MRHIIRQFPRGGTLFILIGLLMYGAGAPAARAAGGPDTTSTTLNCTPNTITANNAITCTVTVTDTASGATIAPAGAVIFSAARTTAFSGFGPGAFTPAPTCALQPTGPASAASSCEVSYTAEAPEYDTITATYPTQDGLHLGSSATANVTILFTTNTIVNCDPAEVAGGEFTTCTATVYDNPTYGIGINFATDPGVSGYVNFSTGGGGGFDNTRCLLQSFAFASSASCRVQYNTNLAGSDPITATYSGGDGLHATSSGSINVTVDTSDGLGVNCKPFDAGTTTTCTATASISHSRTPMTPTGMVSFSSAYPGVFSNGGSCALVPGGSGLSSCQVTFTTNEATTPGFEADEIDAKWDGIPALSFVTVNPRTTNTHMTCTPTSPLVGTPTTCTVTVSDTDSGTASTPTGMVGFGKSVGGFGSHSIGRCTLTPTGAPDTASCFLVYTDGVAEQDTIESDYNGDSAHATNFDIVTVTFTPRASGTSLTCAPNPLPASSATTCTATVNDIDSGTPITPTGTVSFTTDGGAFGAASGSAFGAGPPPTCRLGPSGSSGVARCAVTYTDGVVEGGSITANYSGDRAHGASNANAAVTFTLRASGTSVICAPNPLPVHATTTCTATVSDTDSGAASTPGGTVSFGTTGGGTFGSGGSCPLVPSGTGAAGCSVTYTTSAAGSDTVTAGYGGDSLHAASSGGAALTIDRATPMIVWARPADITYGAALGNTQLDATAEDPTTLQTVAGVFTYTPPAGTVLGAGAGQTLQVSFAPNDSADYNNGGGSTTINVNPAVLTIIARDESMTYGGGVPAFAASYSGFVNGDTSGSLSTAPTCAATDGQGNPVSSGAPAGAYTITCSGAADPNYTITYKSGTLTIAPQGTTLSVSGPAVVAQGGNVTLATTLVGNNTGPLNNRQVTFTLDGSPICQGTTDSTGTATCKGTASANQPLGSQTVTARFAGDANDLASTASQQVVVFAYLTSGAFVIGDQAAASGASVTFWGARWAKANGLSGGSAPASFKGFAASLDGTLTAKGGQWSSGPGNSAGAPGSIPSYVAVIVSSSITKSGSAISGNIIHVVIVKTDPGYASAPGSAGTGTVVAQLW